MKAANIARENAARIDAARTQGENIGEVFESLAAGSVSAAAIRAAYYRLPGRAAKPRQKPQSAGPVSVDEVKALFREQMAARRSDLFSDCVADTEFATLVREGAVSVGIRRVREMLRNSGVVIPERRLKEWLELQAESSDDAPLRSPIATPAASIPGPLKSAPAEPLATAGTQDELAGSPPTGVVSNNKAAGRPGQRHMNAEE